MKILIVEDEQILRESIREYLDYQGYTCEAVGNYNDGREKIAEFLYDVIVVDINLPGGTGLDLVRAMKEQSPKTGIIIISARNSLDDKLTGLELGSDDYLTKPFHLSELNARVKAIIRRRNFDGNRIIQFNEIKLNPDARSVAVNDQSIDLTEKEYQLLEYFMANKKWVLTKSAIAEHVWGDEYLQISNYDFIYTHIKNLRKKLIDAGSGDYIKTVYGTGYKFSDS